jgi:ABC-type sugar transport system ATPase subunit
VSASLKRTVEPHRLFRPPIQDIPVAGIRIEHLRQVYPAPSGREVVALADVSFALAPTELLTVLGPSGSGKTTLLRLIAGLDEPVSGRVEIDDTDVTRAPPRLRDVAMVFQNPALFPHLTAYENMAFGLAIRRLPRAEVRERVQQTAVVLGLSAFLDRKPMELSGGERQRVALGRAIVRRPKLFLLDEPLSSLDAPTRLQLRDEIARLQKELQTPMIYVTHDQFEALNLGHRVLVLHDGAVQQLDTPAAICARPANPFVEGFINALPRELMQALLERPG